MAVGAHGHHFLNVLLLVVVVSNHDSGYAIARSLIPMVYLVIQLVLMKQCFVTRTCVQVSSSCTNRENKTHTISRIKTVTNNENSINVC